MADTKLIYVTLLARTQETWSGWVEVDAEMHEGNNEDILRDMTDNVDVSAYQPDEDYWEQEDPEFGVVDWNPRPGENDDARPVFRITEENGLECLRHKDQLLNPHESNKDKLYRVRLVRTVFESKDVEVYADCPDEADKKAKELAGRYGQYVLGRWEPCEGNAFECDTDGETPEELPREDDE